jgi:hypothetical protein
MTDYGHVGGSVVGSQAHEVVVEDDVENPVEAVFDAPVGADGAGESSGGQRRRRQVIASGRADFAVFFDVGLDHADHGEAGETGFAGKAAVGGEPGHVMADGMPADLDPAMVAIGGVMAVEGLARLLMKEQPHVIGQGGPVVFESEEVIGVLGADGFGDGPLAAHRIDGDQGSFEVKTLQQRRDRGDLVALGRHGLLPQDQTLAAGPGRYGVERAFLRPPRPARGLAIDGDDVRVTIVQVRDPGGKTRGKQLGRQGVHHVIERIVGGNATLEGQKAAQKIFLAPRPAFDFNEILPSCHRAAQDHQQDFRQRINHFPSLARIVQRRKMIQKRPCRHGESLRFEALYESQQAAYRNPPRLQAIALPFMTRG